MISQFLFLLFLEILGLVFMALFRPKLGRPSRYLLSFPMGTALWIFMLMLFLLAGWPLRRGAVLTAGFLMLGAFLFAGWRKKAWDAKEGAAAAVFLAAYAILAFLFLNFNYSFLTNDSLGLVAGGRMIVQADSPPARLLANRGIFSYLLHAAESLWGFDYLYAFYPLCASFLLLFFAYNLYAPFRERKIAFNRHLAYSALAVGFLLSTYFFLLNSAYLHTNLLYGFYFFIAVVGLWRRLRGGEPAWMAVSLLALLSTVFIRVEGPLIALVPVFLLLCSPEPTPKEKRAYIVALSLAVSAWFLKLHFVLSRTTSKILTADRSLVVVLFGLVCLLGLWLREKKALARPWTYAPPAMLYALALLWSYFLWTKGMSLKGGDLIIRRYGALLINLLRDGDWGITWIVLPLLFIAALFLARVPAEGFFVATIVAFGLLFNSINLFRGGWRPGWGDSGNRMLVHIIFVLAFYVFLKFRPLFVEDEGA